MFNGAQRGINEPDEWVIGNDKELHCTGIPLLDTRSNTDAVKQAISNTHIHSRSHMKIFDDAMQLLGIRIILKANNTYPRDEEGNAEATSQATNPALG